MSRESAVTPSFWLPVYSLWKRDVVRFFRQRARVIGALGPPLVFWALMGAGFGQSFQAPGAGSGGYLEFFFPGMVAMTLLFTGVFTNIALIQDRIGGFLQGVLVSPASPTAIALGRVLGGTSVAFLEGVMLMAAAPLVGFSLSLASVALLAVILLVLSFGLTAMGFALAWRMDSVQGFHAIMNFVLAPMWFLSGSVFPVQTAPGWMKAVMLANPMTYGVEAMRGALTVASGTTWVGVAGLPVDLALAAAFAVVAFVGAVVVARKPV